MVLDNSYCKNCNEIYTDINHKWCKPCQINNLKTSGNEKIDKFIQEIQMKFDLNNDIVIELISYNQFNDIKEISKDDLTTIHLAKWKDGPLCYDVNKREYRRVPNETVVLKFLDNSQYDFFNKV